jgi:hypothetical protein
MVKIAENCDIQFGTAQLILIVRSGVYAPNKFWMHER